MKAVLMWRAVNETQASEPTFDKAEAEWLAIEMSGRVERVRVYRPRGRKS